MEASHFERRAALRPTKLTQRGAAVAGRRVRRRDFEGFLHNGPVGPTAAEFAGIRRDFDARMLGAAHYGTGSSN